MYKKECILIHHYFLLLILSLPLAATQAGGPAELYEEERVAAEALAQLHHISINTIAQEKNVSPKTVVDALLWMSEHPSTPMPSTPLNYTQNDIEAAARRFNVSKAQKRAVLQKLNKQEIMAKTGATQQEVDQAFQYYRHKLWGELPTNLPRIKQLAQAQRNCEEQRAKYLKRKRKEFEELNQQEIMEKTGATQQQIGTAFQYRRKSHGELPTSLERIQQLAQFQKNNSEKIQARKKAQRTAAGKKKTSKTPKELAALHKELLEQSIASIGGRDLETIARDAHISPEIVLKAYNMNKITPIVPFPQDAQGLTALADKWSNEYVQAQRRKHKAAIRKSKEKAAAGYESEGD